MPAMLRYDSVPLRVKLFLELSPTPRTGMAIIDPKYSIGIDAMDAQHARWIELIEEFRSAGAEHLLDSIGIEAAKKALEKLLNYTRTHFASEEKLLIDHKYPGLAAHQQCHRELEAAVIKLRDEINANRTNVTPLKLNLFITVWLMEHITQEDQKYARYILGKPARA